MIDFRIMSLMLVFYSANILAQANVIKMGNYACEKGAENFSNKAEQTGRLIPLIISNTTPNSKERMDAIALINQTEDKLKDQWFEYSKKSIKQNREERENGDKSAIDSSLWEYYWDVYIFTISLAFNISTKEPGTSQLTYRRLIEEECRTTVLKK